MAKVTYPKGTYGIVPNLNKIHLLKTRSEIAVFIALCKYANKDTRECFPRLATIAEDTGITKTDTVSDAIKGLIEVGFIEKMTRVRKNGSRASNYYRILCANSKTSSIPSDKAIEDEDAFERTEASQEDVESNGNIISVDVKAPPLQGVQTPAAEGGLNSTSLIEGLVVKTTNSPEPYAIATDSYVDQNNLFSDEMVVNKPKDIWSQSATTQKWLDGKDRAYRIIARFFVLKGFVYTNKSQMEIQAKRHLRDARILEVYTPEQVGIAVEYVQENFSNIDWHLGTVVKCIDNANSNR